MQQYGRNACAQINLEIVAIIFEIAIISASHTPYGNIVGYVGFRCVTARYLRLVERQKNQISAPIAILNNL